MIRNTFCQNDVSFLLPLRILYIRNDSGLLRSLRASLSIPSVPVKRSPPHVLFAFAPLRLRRNPYATPALLFALSVGRLANVPTDLLRSQPPAGGQNDRQHPEDGSPVARVLHPRACCRVVSTRRYFVHFCGCMVTCTACDFDLPYLIFVRTDHRHKSTHNVSTDLESGSIHSLSFPA